MSKHFGSFKMALEIKNSIHTEYRKYKSTSTYVFTFFCKKCQINTIKIEKKLLKTTKGLCKSCASKGIPYKHTYNHFKDGVMRTNKKRTKYKKFDLSFEDFLEFVKIKNCHYCNKHINWTKHTGKGNHRSNLDRKDSNIGYVKNNLVVCCKECNYMKGSEFSYNEFKHIVQYLHKTRKNGFIWRKND